MEPGVRTCVHEVEPHRLTFTVSEKLPFHWPQIPVQRAGQSVLADLSEKPATAFADSSRTNLSTSFTWHWKLSHLVSAMGCHFSSSLPLLVIFFNDIEEICW
jgi:hypothetical protein